MTTTTDLPIEQITPHTHNVRRDLGDLTELAASIKAMGLLQPLTVAPNGDGYVVVAGHRRLEAAKQAGLPAVPCVIRADLVKPADQIEAMLVENLQRSDLTVMEEATAYAQLELLGVKPTAIAKATGRSSKTVTTRLKLMSLPEQSRAKIDQGQLSLTDAEYLLKWADDEEIMKAIDGKTGQNARWAAESIIRQREWDKKKPQREAEEKERAKANQARSKEHEQERAKREARSQAILTSLALTHTWLDERIDSGDKTLADQLTRYAVDYIAAQDVEDLALRALGVPEIWEDDDVDDHILRVAAMVKAWPITKARLAVALWASNVLDPDRWAYTEHLQRLIDLCGYQPSDAEKQLLSDGKVKP